MKSTLYILVIGGLLMIAGAVTYFVMESKPPLPVQQTSLTNAKGFWQNIHTENDEHEAVFAPAFFCNQTGKYEGHIIDSGGGWWIAYASGEKKLGSYASEAFAKKAVEDGADCEPTKRKDGE